MKYFVAVILVLSVIAVFAVPAPVDAGGNGFAVAGALLGGFLLGSVLNSDRLIVGPVYPYYYSPPVYPSPFYYPPPVVYQRQPIWIPERYEWQPQIVCEVVYMRQHCYPAQTTVIIPGHWEYR